MTDRTGFLVNSPENRRILRAYALDPANGPLVDPALESTNWEVIIGGPIYRQILPLANFATGSPAWADEMTNLAILYPLGGVPVPPLVVVNPDVPAVEDVDNKVASDY